MNRMMLGDLHVVTIGLYGFTEAAFFNALKNANVDTFCDIRQRRGVRGAAYRFANSSKLQERLEELGIRYHHCKQLAPTPEIREIQKTYDREHRQSKSKRETLSKAFIAAYEEIILSDFNSSEWLGKFGAEWRVIALFCVEKNPSACHRSLAAQKVSQILHAGVKHLEP